MGSSSAAALRQLVRAGKPLVLPGAANALTAGLVEQAGFEAVYLTGAGVTNSLLGVADLGLLTATELAEQVAAMVDSVAIPVIVDADTGFGGPLNVARTFRQLERAGAAAIEIEDQTMPKRCGHFDGKTVVSVTEMLARIYAALDARDNDDVMLIARTDAREVNGFEDAIERACRYAEAGADMTFIEAPRSADEVAAVPRRVPGPQILNVVEGGKTPMPSYEEVASAGYAAVLYANSTLRASIKSTREVLDILRQHGSTAAALDLMATWEERQQLVHRDELEQRSDAYYAQASALPHSGDALSIDRGPALGGDTSSTNTSPNQHHLSQEA